MSVLLDSTLGLVLMYICLHISSYFIGKYRIVLLYSGEYGRPPSYKVRLYRTASMENLMRTRHHHQPWLAQCGLYLVIAICEKAIVASVMLAPIFSSVCITASACTARGLTQRV